MDSGKYSARSVDELGRIVLPTELRKRLGISECDKMDISVDGDKIIMQKSVPSCVVCDSTSEIQQLNGKSVCNQCHIKLTA